MNDRMQGGMHSGRQGGMQSGIQDEMQDVGCLVECIVAYKMQGQSARWHGINDGVHRGMQKMYCRAVDCRVTRSGRKLEKPI